MAENRKKFGAVGVGAHYELAAWIGANLQTQKSEREN